MIVCRCPDFMMKGDDTCSSLKITIMLDVVYSINQYVMLLDKGNIFNLGAVTAIVTFTKGEIASFQFILFREIDLKRELHKYLGCFLSLFPPRFGLVLVNNTWLAANSAPFESKKSLENYFNYFCYSLLNQWNDIQSS